MPATILLIEDHASFRWILRKWLEVHFAEYQVIEATNEVEALALAQANAPHVVIIDNSLPAMEDLEAVKYIKNITPATPIVILTDHPHKIHFSPATTNDVTYVGKDMMLIELRPTLARFLSSQEQINLA